MAITTLPPAPQRTDPDNFNSKAAAFVDALAGFVTDANALGADVVAKQALAAASETTASVAASLATTAQGAPKWVSGTTYAIGDPRWSPANGLPYRRLTAGAGTTDPSADATNWVSLATGSFTTLRATSADGVSNFKLYSASAVLRSRYIDTTYGLALEASNLGETAYLPLSLTGSTVKLNTGTGGASITTLDSAGNLGLGTVPYAWHSSLRAIDMSLGSVAANASTTVVGQNIFVDGSLSYSAKATNFAASYAQINGEHSWRSTSTSITAGANANGVVVATISANKSLALQGATSVTGTGISFPATQLASSDPNTLDDYEEGTWTPSIGGTASYTTQAGTYTKVGRLVYFSGNLTINIIGTGSTSQVSGLPFTAASGSVNFPVGIGYFFNTVNNIISLAGEITSGQSSFFLYSSGAAANSNSVVNIFGNGTHISVSGFYFV